MTKFTVFTVLSAIVLIAVASSVQAGKGKNLWRQIDENRVQQRGRRLIVPEKYLVYRVNADALKQILADAPLEFTDAARNTEIIFELPAPDGTMERFRIEESPIFASEVAAQFPTWKNFTGRGIDDPAATAAFDINVNGFHGYVSGSKGTYLVNPYSEFDRENYIVYYKGDLNRNGNSFSCPIGDGSVVDTTLENSFDNFLAPQFSNGENLRTLRLAVSATKEYTNFFSGNVTTAFAAIGTSVARMNLIYRRDLAVRFTIVSDTRTVFTNANDGGFPDASNTEVASLSLTRNQIVIDTAYGNANYDIGHVVSRTGNPNGLAASPSICATGNKAKGFTGAEIPQGDGYDVDYFAHELGHQFGMSHTFNNIANGSCGGNPPSRSMTSAYEPASGVTIMGYGGICAPRNLASNSIDIFHPRSLEQSLAELATEPPAPEGTCGTTQATGNTAPAVSAGPGYTIPKLTPFTLTGSATDATTSGLTYDWEEYDLGAPTSSSGAADTDADGMARPIFRSYNPTTSPSRTFPSLTYILNNANTPPATYTGTLPTAPTTGSTNGYVCAATEEAPCVVGESLPTIARTMTFRLTVRDNFDANSGGVADATTTVNVVNTSGAFQLTSQNAATTWQPGTQQTITWNVAGTTANGINAANVNILLSTDGGQTFPITVSPNTPNDGTEQITVPNVGTATARIKIQPTNNIFFDINNVNFAINSTLAIRAPFDFDGDGRTDISVFRPSQGIWYLNRSAAGLTAVTFGATADLITPADFDGDGKTDVSVFRPSTGEWYRLNSANSTFAGVQFGQNGDLPRPADFDGDGRADINVFRPSNGVWYRLNSTSGQSVTSVFGQNGDVPVPADYNGDGSADLAVFRASENRWYIARPTGVPAQNFDVVNFGTTGDIAVPANYDGDTKTDVAVFRPSTGIWYRQNSSNGQFFAVQFGTNGDVPVAGDYDGDGKADVAVFRPSTGAWYSLNSQSGSQAVQFGAAADKPVPAAFVN